MSFANFSNKQLRFGQIKKKARILLLSKNQQKTNKEKFTVNSAISYSTTEKNHLKVKIKQCRNK